MHKLNFVLNNGFNWYTEDNITVKGYLFDAEKNLYQNKRLIQYFKSVETQHDLKEKILDVTGLFAVVIHFKTEILIASDIIRTFPIFYSTQKDVLYISDSIDEILKSIGKPKLNNLAKDEILSSGFVTGTDTLLKNVYVTRSGEISVLKLNDYKTESYFNYYTSSVNNSDYEQKKKYLKQKINATFERLVKSLDGRKAVIPLSGGFDSRLIACKLKELNYTNVLCYSYGKSTDNQEKIISEKVAKTLGFEWKFIEYNERTAGNYLNDETFLQYVSYYSQFSTCFMFHDYFAIKYFKENDIIPQDAVIIPGHSGDFLGGSQLYKNGNLKYQANLKRIAKSIFSNRFVLTKLSKSSEKDIINSILHDLERKYTGVDRPYAYSIFEDWEIKENLSKLIAKSAHIYDYFGYEFRLPFWDTELANYCKTLPYEDKFGKILYDDVLTNYFKKLSVNFKEGRIISPFTFKIYRIKKFIKSFIPSAIINLLSPANDDALNYNFAQQQLIKDLTKNKKLSLNNIKHRNAYFTHWYILQIEKSLNTTK